MIPFKKINLGNSYEQIKPLFDSGMVGLGEVTAQFEKELAEYIGAKHVLAVSSCTAAIYISVLWDKMHGLKKVCIPSMTQALVPNAILQAGVKISHFNDDTAWVGGRYTLKSSTVIDSAHQTKRHDYPQMFQNTKLCYSFYPTKVIGSIDGGAIASNDSEFIEWARSFTLYGRGKGTSKNSWEYPVERLGGKYNYNDVQAAVCLEQLRRLDQTHAKIQSVVSRYNAAFGLTNDSDYLYRIEVKDRKKFIDYMVENGVQCGVHFQPLHTMEPFKDIPVVNASAIEEAYSKTVSLPLYDLLTDDEVNKIITLVNNYRTISEV